MTRGTIFTTLALGMLLTVLLIVPPTAYAQSGQSNGAFSVAVLRGGTWQSAGTLAFGQNLTEQRLDLSGWVSVGQVSVRLTNPGSTAAHIDAVRLGSVAPRAVSGAAEEPSLALKKLASRDYDVIDVAQRTLTFTFDLPVGETAIFALAARIEAEQIPGVPFEFPTSNVYGAVDATSQFYTYRLNSAPGALTVNGDLNDENLGEPFFKEWSQPVTGHPANFTYGWVRNDASNLYVAIDFAPDNTYDGDKDYTAVYVKTANGVMKFRVSVPEQQWGVPGFVYTGKAVYQHKVYEYKIPLAQIGVSANRDSAVELAFEAYGTAATTSTVSITGHNPNPSLVGQTVVVAFSVSCGDGGKPQSPRQSGNVTVTAGTFEPSCLGALGQSQGNTSTGSCNLTFTTPGTKNLIATYGGEINACAPSVSQAAPHQVLAPVPASPKEVPEGDTLLLLGGGLSGLGVWLRWQWSKRHGKR